MHVFMNEKENVTFISVKNDSGMEVVLCTLGASIYDIKVIDRYDVKESVVLYPSNLTDFYTNDGYHGKCVGRYSGRIDKGICEINGQKYNLDINWNKVNSLHGGFEGISFQNFEYSVKQLKEEVQVDFYYKELAGQLPGDVEYAFSYLISKDANDIKLILKAKTNADTLVNLTNHTYFNLSGEIKRDILKQKLQLNCDKYTRLNNELITESIVPVNQAMDFRKLHNIGDYIMDKSLQNHIAYGYDHCWIKENTDCDTIAVLVDSESGRRLTVSSSYPAIVCYAGCYPKAFRFNAAKRNIGQYHSICLECQYVPNGINMNGVDKAILKANDEYCHYIKYHFDTIGE